MAPARASKTINGAAEDFRVTRGSWLPGAWDKEVEELARHLRLWFQEASSRYAPPTEDGCRTFAQQLLTYDWTRARGTSQGEKEARRTGKIFLKALTSEREFTQRILHASNVIGPEAEKRQQELGTALLHMQAAKRHLEFLFDHWSDKPSRAGTEPIRFLAHFAQELWKETNGGHSPSLKGGADGPVCRLLERILGAVHAKVGREDISKVLRKERRSGTRYKTGD